MPSEGKTLAKVLKGSQAFPLLLFISFCPLTHCKQICSGNVSFLLTGYCFIILFFTKNNLISMCKKTFSQGLPSWHLQCNGNASTRDWRQPPPGWLFSVQAAILYYLNINFLHKTLHERVDDHLPIWWPSSVFSYICNLSLSILLMKHKFQLYLNIVEYNLKSVRLKVQYSIYLLDVYGVVYDDYKVNICMILVSIWRLYIGYYVYIIGLKIFLLLGGYKHLLHALLVWQSHHLQRHQRQANVAHKLY